MSEFESFDYTKVTVAENQMSQYMDGYKHFGWRVDSNVPIEKGMGKVTIHLKRSRAVLNKMELTRLQRHFEACMSEIAALENSTESFAMIAALTSGISGCAFMAGSVFAVTAAKPIIWLMILLAIPGFFLWGIAYPLYKNVKKWREEKVKPLIEAKLDEAEKVCEKGHALLCCKTSDGKIRWHACGKPGEIHFNNSETKQKQFANKTSL